MGGGWQRSGVRRRSLIDVYADILDAIDDGSCKTNIVYKANLNYNRCRRYVRDLARCGLVKVHTSSPSTWAVTEKGREFLKKHGELGRLILPR